MVVELDPLPRGKDIQPIAVGQVSTRCNGDKTGVSKSYIAVAVVIFIMRFKLSHTCCFLQT